MLHRQDVYHSMQHVFEHTPSSSWSDAEIVAYYVAKRVRQQAHNRWLQAKTHTNQSCLNQAPILQLFAKYRLYQVPSEVTQALLAWSQHQRHVELLYRVPSAYEVLAWQAKGIRCVSLLEDGSVLLPHRNGLEFAIHDLCHLEKFFDPEHRTGQLGFFRIFLQAIQNQEWVTFEQDFDSLWQKERNYVMADMNGSAIFLFAALKMKLKMAVRRTRAYRLGMQAPANGALSNDEQLEFEQKFNHLLDLFLFEGEVRQAAHEISARRDCQNAANVLLKHFEWVGQ